MAEAPAAAVRATEARVRKCIVVVGLREVEDEEVRGFDAKKPKNGKVATVGIKRVTAAAPAGTR